MAESEIYADDFEEPSADLSLLEEGGPEEHPDADVADDDSYSDEGSPQRETETERETDDTGGIAGSLERYLQQYEDMEDGEDIMAAITKGLDGLSPPVSGRNDATADDSDDSILKKFGIEVSPRAENDNFLEKYLKAKKASDSVESSPQKQTYAHLIDREKTDRGYEADEQLKVVELKRKVSQLQEKLTRDGEVRQRLKEMCTSLKTELFQANEKCQMLYAELQQQSKKKKVRKVKASGTKASKLAEENEALKAMLQGAQLDQHSQTEKISALVALNEELGLQLRQSLAREADWRSAHQQLSDRLIRQSNASAAAASASIYGSVSAPQLGERGGNGQKQHHVASYNGHPLAGPQRGREKRDFKVDVHCSESDGRSQKKHIGSKMFPPL